MRRCAGEICCLQAGLITFTARPGCNLRITSKGTTPILSPYIIHATSMDVATYDLFYTPYSDRKNSLRQALFKFSRSSAPTNGRLQGVKKQ